jgi:hypothetical protein
MTQVGDVIHGTWFEAPWGVGDDYCFDITLESGVRIHAWLEGVTDRAD